MDLSEMTEEGLKALEEKATKADSLEKEKAETEAKLKELEDDVGNKDWKKARTKIAALEKAAAKEGKVFDDESGEIKSVEQKFTPEDIDKRAEAAAERIAIAKAVKRAKKDLSDEDAEVFDKYFKKVTHEEDVNSDNVDDFIDQAWTVAGATGSSKTMVERSAGTRGGAPNMAKPSEDYADSEAGKTVLERMGLATEAKTDKK